MKKKVALIFGLTGQDGSYLTEFLLKKNYIIHGVKRRSSSANTERVDHLFDSLNFSNRNFFIHYGDISDGTSTLNIINKIKPDEIYNLAAQSHVRLSFDMPAFTAQVNAVGALNVFNAALEKCENAIRNCYWVLLTRGSKGCFVYSEDPQVRDYLKRMIEK